MYHTVETLGFDREVMFPKYHADVLAGRLLVGNGAEYAQDRVAMKRYILSAFPLLTNLRGMDTKTLSEICDSIIQLRGGVKHGTPR